MSAEIADLAIGKVLFSFVLAERQGRLLLSSSYRLDDSNRRWDYTTPIQLHIHAFLRSRPVLARFAAGIFFLWTVCIALL